MRAKLAAFLFSIVLFSACTPTHRLYWQESRNAAHYSNIGIRNARKGQYQKAIPMFQKALEIDPNLITARQQLALAHANLGKNYLEWHQYALASTQFKIALDINPNLSLAKQGLKTAARQMQILALER